MGTALLLSSYSDLFDGDASETPPSVGSFMIARSSTGFTINARAPIAATTNCHAVGFVFELIAQDMNAEAHINPKVIGAKNGAVSSRLKRACVMLPMSSYSRAIILGGHDRRLD